MALLSDWIVSLKSKPIRIVDANGKPIWEGKALSEGAGALAQEYKGDRH